MNTPQDRRRAAFLGLPIFEMFYGILLLTMIAFSFIAPIIRWLFR